MARSKKPQRTLLRAVDLSTRRVIISDDLLRLDPDAYQQVRRAAVAARRERLPRYACDLCGHPVYAPKEPRTKLPYWRHNKGAPRTCDWWTGEPGTIDQNSARQFDGLQESPLHLWLKNWVGEALKSDASTEDGSVFVDEYLITEAGRRRPDVRATYDGRRVAFEIQLSSTQLPIIDAREHFYTREGFNLVWLTWNFQPVELSKMITAFNDIFHSHSHNIFSLDREVIERSERDRTVCIRAFWNHGDGWHSKVMPLAELQWLGSGLPCAVTPPPPPIPWREDFIARWRTAIIVDERLYKTRAALFEELIEQLELVGSTPASLSDALVHILINTILSLIDKAPFGTRQSNLTEVLNTFLQLTSRHSCARLIKAVVKATGNEALLERATTKAKLDAAWRTPQLSRSSVEGRIALGLFPHLFETRATARAA